MEIVKDYEEWRPGSLVRVVFVLVELWQLPSHLESMSDVLSRFPWNHDCHVGLLACKVQRDALLRDILVLLPGWFIFSSSPEDEFQCTVSFPSVLKQTMDQSCIAVEDFRVMVGQGGSAPMDF